MNLAVMVLWKLKCWEDRLSIADSESISNISQKHYEVFRFFDCTDVSLLKNSNTIMKSNVGKLVSLAHFSRDPSTKTENEVVLTHSNIRSYTALCCNNGVTF